MDASKTDSFSISSNSRVVESRCFRTSIVWKIVCVQERAGIEDKPITSPNFQFCNKSWELAVYSADRFSSEQLCVDFVELRCVDINPSSAFSISLNHCTVSDGRGSILKKITNKVFCIFHSKNFHFITGCFHVKETSSLTISLNMCSNESTKGQLQEIIKEENKDTLMSCDSKLSSDFEGLLRNHHLSDVTLKLGEEEFPAHKSVLSARSKVFAAMFEHDTKKNRQGTVDLVQMKADTVQDMLRYIYCGKIRIMSVEEALDLYEAAGDYDLPELRDICREVAVRGISLTNVFEIAEVADIYNDELIISELISFISRNGANIINTEDWKEMYTVDPCLGTRILEWLLRGKKC